MPKTLHIFNVKSSFHKNGSSPKFIINPKTKNHAQSYPFNKNNFLVFW